MPIPGGTFYNFGGARLLTSRTWCEAARGDARPTRQQKSADNQFQSRSMNGGFPQASLDPLQRLNAFALEKTFSGARQNGFGGKTILDAKRILHDPFQPFLRFRHVSKAIARTRIRKLKNPAQLNGIVLISELRVGRDTPCAPCFTSAAVRGLPALPKFGRHQLNLSFALARFRA